MKLSIEKLTSMDKNINVLIETKGRCDALLYTGECHAVDCKRCSKHKNFYACYNALPICDKLRVDNGSKPIAANYIMAHRALQRDRAAGIGGIAIIAAMLIGGLALVGARADTLPDYRTSDVYNYYQNDDYLIKVLNKTHKYIYDVNKDGTINCIDYAKTFKRIWDQTYPAGTNNCEIVWNVNEAKHFNHLFIRCRPHKHTYWLYVEPQAHINDYKMTDYWGDKYVFTYNYYGYYE